MSSSAFSAMRERAAATGGRGRAARSAWLAIATLLTAAACAIGPPGGTRSPAAVIKPDWAVQDADWMMGAAIAGGPMDGALATYPDQEHVMPYFANLGALGLARASQLSGNDRYVEAVWRHLAWYAGRMDRDGYVRDYDLIGGSWVPAPNAVNKSAPYDSTDSYAGTFLLALRAAFRVHQDRSRLEQLRPAVARAVSAIRSTQDSDGLTWARPGYPSKILMDAVESYQGMVAAAEIAQILGDASLAGSARQSGEALRRGIESLWNASKGHYYLEKEQDGSLESPRWSQLDPGAMAQAWAVAFQAAPLDRARKLMREFDRNQPRWDDPRSNGLQDPYDITPAGWAYWRIGQGERARRAAATLRGRAVADRRAWPFSVATCGELIVLETDGTALVFG
jgi:hypothetical protein